MKKLIGYWNLLGKYELRVMNTPDAYCDGMGIHGVPGAIRPMDKKAISFIKIKAKDWDRSSLEFYDYLRWHRK